MNRGKILPSGGPNTPDSSVNRTSIGETPPSSAELALERSGDQIDEDLEQVLAERGRRPIRRRKRSRGRDDRRIGRNAS
jgi:hypothetical protein